jgi:hypothetical protein
MEELFQSGSIDQNRSSANWPLAKILQRYMNHVTRRLGLSLTDRGIDVLLRYDAAGGELTQKDVTVSMLQEAENTEEEAEQQQARKAAAVKALMTARGVEFWTPLIGAKSGRIKLRMRLEPFESDDAVAANMGAGGNGTLIVSLRRASNLYNRHTGSILDPQSRPFPYVTLTAGGFTRVSRRATGTNPEFWQDFQFPNIDPITDATGVLEVVVWDNFRVVFRKPIGGAMWS